MNISHESPDEAQTTIEESDELSNEDKDKFVPCDDNDVDNVFKNSPIDEQNDFDDLAIYNNNNDSIGVSDEHGEDGDITLPPVNMMMDVLEHMLTEVSAAPTVSSSSSSISEPAPEPLDIVPDSPKSITSSPFIMDSSDEKTKESNIDPNSQSNDDKQTSIDTFKCTEPVEKKKGNKLSLVCDRISKISKDPSSDISTPSPIEEISKLQLQIAQQETRASDSSNTATSTAATPTSLSTMSLLSSVMSIHANKALTEKESNEEDSNVSSKATGETKSSLKASIATATTVNACADFFNALLKSDKTLTSVSNQGN